MENIYIYLKFRSGEKEHLMTDCISLFPALGHLNIV